MKRVPAAIGVLLIMGLACGQRPKASAGLIRVGYFPNITHSQALIGLSRGDFQNALGPEVTIKTTIFNAGPSAIEALFAGQIDLAYLGPNPAINGYVQSKGRALRIIAGATSAGAAMVVRSRSKIRTAADLKGKRIASPQLGNTQDVALRNYLVSKGFKPVEQGGTVRVIPTQNPMILDLFRRGEVDGAWVPEPWASRLIVEGDGKLFLDERDLWPGGDFVTAHLIVAAEFLEKQPEMLRAWLRAHVEVTQWELASPAEAKALLNAQMEKLIGKKLVEQVLEQSWTRLRPTWDPIASSLIQCADSAYAAGFLKSKPDLANIYSLTLLNEVLQQKDLPPVR